MIKKALEIPPAGASVHYSATERNAFELDQETIVSFCTMAVTIFKGV
jgi:hypothetical protein